MCLWFPLHSAHTVLLTFMSYFFDHNHYHSTQANVVWWTKFDAVTSGKALYKDHLKIWWVDHQGRWFFIQMIYKTGSTEQVGLCWRPPVQNKILQTETTHLLLRVVFIERYDHSNHWECLQKVIRHQNYAQRFCAAHLTSGRNKKIDQCTKWKAHNSPRKCEGLICEQWNLHVLVE